jgi:replicative DNA helicase
VIADAETELLGALMLSKSRATQSVVAEIGLKADHFYLDRHRDIYDAILAVVDAGADVPDELLVAEHLNADDQTRNYVSQLCSTVGAPGNAIHFAQAVVKRADWRRTADASGLLTQAVKEADETKLAEARELLTASHQHRRTTLTPDDLVARLEQIMEGSARKEFPFPFPKFNDWTAGGLGRKEHHAIAGHSSHGKSLWIDQLFRYWGGIFRVHLYINEMNEDSRLVRQVNTERGVSFTNILAGDLNDAQKQRVREIARTNLVFGITDATGWTAREISNDIRLNRWDIAGVDLLHNIAPEPSETSQEQTLTNASRILTDTSRLANCLVVSVSHLNERRSFSVEKPKPVLSDLRGSGMIKNSADSVAFVWRKQDLERGLPEPEGEIILAKVRNGVPGWLDVRVDRQKLEFLEIDHQHADFAGAYA